VFTGIVEELGTVESLSGGRLVVAATQVLSDLRTGASIAVNGVCLTAVGITSRGFSADLSPETLSRTNLGDLAARSRVNLERPLSPTGRLSGHIMQGHVDGVAELLALDPLRDGNWWLAVRPPAELLRYLVFKGSVALDGISLTVAFLEAGRLGVAIIPHTYQATNLCTRRPGDRINIECDIIAKHVEKLLQGMQLRPGAGVTVDQLREQGF
jgi:riboflavin synthase